MFLAKISQNTMVEPIEIYITFSFVIDKPPDDPYERKWYFKRKQQYTRFLRFYGNSLVGGIDQAKIITVTETETKKKRGKKKPGKVVSIREIKFDVTWSYVKRQTAKMTSEFVFFSSNPSLNCITIEKCLLIIATNTNIFTLLFNELETDNKSFLFAVCRLTYDHVTLNLISLLTETFTHIRFSKYLELPFTIYIKNSNLHNPVKKTPQYLLYTLDSLQSKKAAQIIEENKQKGKGVSFMQSVVQARMIYLIFSISIDPSPKWRPKIQIS